MYVSCSLCLLLETDRLCVGNSDSVCRVPATSSKNEIHPTGYVLKHLIWTWLGHSGVFYSLCKWLPSHNTGLSMEAVVLVIIKLLLQRRAAALQWEMRRMWMETEVKESKKQTKQWDIKKGRRGVGGRGRMMRTTAVPLMWVSLGPYMCLRGEGISSAAQAPISPPLKLVLPSWAWKHKSLFTKIKSLPFWNIKHFNLNDETIYTSANLKVQTLVQIWTRMKSQSRPSSHVILYFI